VLAGALESFPPSVESLDGVLLYAGEVVVDGEEVVEGGQYVLQVPLRQAVEQASHCLYCEIASE